MLRAVGQKYIYSRKLERMIMPFVGIMGISPSRHNSSDKTGKLRETRHKGRKSVVESSPCEWTGQKNLRFQMYSQSLINLTVNGSNKIKFIL